MAFDLSSQGKSDGDLITLGLNEKYDLLGAVSYLKSRDHTGDNIGVIGFSMGAATTLLAANENDDIKAVIADSPFRNAGLFLREGLPFFQVYLRFHSVIHRHGWQIGPLRLILIPYLLWMR